MLNGEINANLKWQQRSEVVRSEIHVTWNIYSCPNSVGSYDSNTTNHSVTGLPSDQVSIAFAQYDESKH